MSDLTTPYDTVAYPSMVFEQSHPQRTRMIARLHGVDAPPVETARILEIGGGDGLNALALAAAYPQAQIVSFDLAPTAVQRGQAIAVASGMTNVEIVLGDILDGCQTYAAGSFDYIIAHGVYAWVPDAVRAATMALIAHALSPTGVGFVSYNALPGGHLRRMMRDMLLHSLERTTGTEARIAATRQLLDMFAKPQTGDDSAITALREQASSMLDRPPEVLFHDELGDVFAPQSLTQVVEAAHAVGLRFLSDDPALRTRSFDGFLPDDIAAGDDVEDQVIRAAQSADYAAVRFFRRSLFVRNDVLPVRRLDTARMDGLWMACSVTPVGNGVYKSGQQEFTIADEELARLFDIVIADFPERFPVMDKVVDVARRQAVLYLFSHGYVEFHDGPTPFPLTAGPRPQASPLVRGALKLNLPNMATLAHRMITIGQPELQALLIAADGTRTIAELAALPDIGFPADQIEPALNAAARRGLMIA